MEEKTLSIYNPAVVLLFKKNNQWHLIKKCHVRFPIFLAAESFSSCCGRKSKLVCMREGVTDCSLDRSRHM